MENIVYQILILMFMVLSAVFSGSETALISSNSIKIRNLSEKGNKKAKKALEMQNNIEEYIGLLLIGNNIVNISATAFIIFVASKTFILNEYELFFITAVQTIVFLLLCEILPKTVSRNRPEAFLMFFSYPLAFFMTFLKPVIRISLLFSDKMKEVFKLESSKDSIIGSRDEIGHLFKLGEKEGIIDEDHWIFVDEILSFREETAAEVMTPTIDIVSIERKDDIKHLVKLIEDTRFSRIPVYENRVDNIIGFIHFRDLLYNNKVKKIDEILKKPYFIPTTKKIYKLFTEMQDNNIPIAFVVNEFGAVVGLITYEDIAEEIVGEIQTRDHPDEELIKKIHHNKFIIDGSLDIEYFQREFNLVIEKKGFGTVAGFIMHQLGKIPKKGDTLKSNGYIFTVIDATDRSIEKIAVTRRQHRKK